MDWTPVPQFLNYLCHRSRVAENASGEKYVGEHYHIRSHGDSWR